MITVRNVQIIPVAPNADFDRVTALPSKRGASVFYLLMNDGNNDHEIALEKRDEIISYLDKCGFDDPHFEKVTVSVNFLDFDDCLQKLAAITGNERKHTGLHFNMSFDAGMLNAAGLIACSIIGADAVIVGHNQSLFFMPRYPYPGMLDVESRELLGLYHDRFKLDPFSYADAFPVLDIVRPDLKGRRTYQYNEVKRFMDDMKARRYIDVKDNGKKNDKRFSITPTGKMLIDFFDCYG